MTSVTCRQLIPLPTAVAKVILPDRRRAEDWNSLKFKLIRRQLRRCRVALDDLLAHATSERQRQSNPRRTNSWFDDVARSVAGCCCLRRGKIAGSLQSLMSLQDTTLPSPQCTTTLVHEDVPHATASCGAVRVYAKTLLPLAPSLGGCRCCSPPRPAHTHRSPSHTAHSLRHKHASRRPLPFWRTNSPQPGANQ